MTPEMAKTSSNSGVIIYKETFDLLLNNKLNQREFIELIKLIYSTRWEGSGVSENEIKNPKTELVWAGLAHSYKRNAEKVRSWEKTNKSNIDITPNAEFDTKPTTVTKTTPKKNTVKRNPMDKGWVDINGVPHSYDEEMPQNPQNKAEKTTDDTNIPQETERATEGLKQGKFKDLEEQFEEEVLKRTDIGDAEGNFMGFTNETIIETRGVAPQISMEELQRQTIEREKRREEFANNWKAHNVQIVGTEPEERELTFEMIDRCVDRFDKDIALKQVKPYLSIEENIKRLRGRLNSVLQGFSQDERDWYYGLLIESKNQ